MIENEELGGLVDGLRFENEQLRIMVSFLRQNAEQTHIDFKEELGIARDRYLKQGTRADELEKQLEKQNEASEKEIKRLNDELHKVKGWFAGAFGFLQLLNPDEETLKMLSHYDENTQLLSWPCLISVGLLREIHQAVQTFEEQRQAHQEKTAVA